MPQNINNKIKLNEENLSDNCKITQKIEDKNLNKNINFY